jgi:acetyl esterase/lipase
MDRTLKLAAMAALAVLAGLAGLASAEVPPALAERLAAIGPVIDPGATARLYAPQVTEKEPYMNVNVERDVAYGPAPRNLLDVFAPAGHAGKGLPVVVFLHGGAFVAGNRRSGPDSPFYDNVMLWATHHGMVGVNMTYRLAPQDPWPAGPQDIAQALRWVQDNIGRRGGDPARVFLFGHSAGASHVAAYVARPEFHAAGTHLAGAMLLSGVYRVTPELVAQSPTYPAYFGNDSARYLERSSLDGLIACGTPLWVGQAELDPPQFKAQAELLRDGLRTAGRPFATATFSAHSHMSEAYSINSGDRTVGDALWAFVEAHGDGVSLKP